jgi:hypothetical protein
VRLLLWGAVALAFLLRHWAAATLIVLVVLVATVFAPRGMLEAVIGAAIVGAAVAVAALAAGS